MTRASVVIIILETLAGSRAFARINFASKLVRKLEARVGLPRVIIAHSVLHIHADREIHVHVYRGTTRLCHGREAAVRVFRI